MPKRADVRLLHEIGVRQLVCQHVAVAGVAAGKTGLQSQLTFAVEIAVCRVEVVEARLQKSVHHAAGLRGVYLAVLHGQPHIAKTEILLDPIHRTALPFCVVLLPGVVLHCQVLPHRLARVNTPDKKQACPRSDSDSCSCYDQYSRSSVELQ